MAGRVWRADANVSAVWTTLITNTAYLTGLLTLDYALKKHGSKYPLIALYTDTFPEEGHKALDVRQYGPGVGQVATRTTSGASRRPSGGSRGPRDGRGRGGDGIDGAARPDALLAGGV